MNIKKYILLLNMIVVMIIPNLVQAAHIQHRHNTTKYTHTIPLKKHSKKLYLKKARVVQKKEIIECFSFLCPRCYRFFIMNQHNNILNNKYKIIQYHINLVDSELSLISGYNWIMAQVLGVEQKVMKPIFEGIHKTHTIYDYETMKKVFIKYAGINDDIYEATWDNTIVKNLFVQQNNTVKNYDINNLPALIVKNKVVDISNILDHCTKNKICLNNIIKIVKRV
ncbi:hypothetical protein GJT87_01970 [Enterobacteriaceae endosymbiont of Macroplea mutica]|uniref:hypothetical protein n=1 Tax=Enterobacteriaceae endosymbiont of Macroplea mutica TaxID=2675791 RepID=UPI001448C876|nr:hypothetical protein [Enterobacteriaceae endosymbiont of Macroplea mutica]QJC31392.1 hypothetical protein GJT87_01970 [Enterobacteriaceae endosymbiont of Macroplea mutica]